MIGPSIKSGGSGPRDAPPGTLPSQPEHCLLEEMPRGRATPNPVPPRAVLHQQNEDTVAQRHHGSFVLTDWDQAPEQARACLGAANRSRLEPFEISRSGVARLEHRCQPARQFTLRRRETLPLPKAHHVPTGTARHPPEFHEPSRPVRSQLSSHCARPRDSEHLQPGPVGHAPGTPGKVHTGEAQHRCFHSVCFSQ